MSLIVSVPEIKRSSTADLIETMKKISNVLMERDLNDPDFDFDQVFRKLLSEPCFNNSKDVREPFHVTDSIIGVPSLMPKKDASGRTKGDSVIPVVQVPGREPYSGYEEDTETFIDKQTVNLRGGRSVTLHSVVPGMIVSFHHYGDDGNGYRVRTSIDAMRIDYDDEGEMIFEQMTEEDALFNLPDLSKEK